MPAGIKRACLGFWRSNRRLSLASSRTSLLVAILIGVTSVSGCAETDHSAQLGGKAGDWLVNGDIFYDPSSSAANIDALCERNYQADSSKVGNRDLYIEACKNAFFNAQNQSDYNNPNSQNELRPTELPSNTSSELPSDTSSDLPSDTVTQEPTYWNPSVENMISCSKNESDECGSLPRRDNTFGNNSLNVAKELVDLSICSQLNTEGYGFTNGPNEAACSIPYNEPSCEVYIASGDSTIWMTVKAPRSWFDASKGVLKDGLVVTLFCSDYYGIDEQKNAEDSFLAQISDSIGGEIHTFG